MTRLNPQFFEYDDSIARIDVRVDGELQSVPLGSEVLVRDRFRVEAPDDYRVNVIGWKRKGLRNEAFVEVRRGEIAKRFSVDKEATAFRVELYRGKKFSGMVLIRFLDDADGSTAERPSVSAGHTSLALNR